jgi:tRNA A37 threonylcarbamoyladenosine modification protein TsaB
VSSLDVLALAAGPLLPVRVLVEAGRGRYATALYIDGQPVGDATLASLEEVVALLTEKTVVIGELRAEARQRLELVHAVRLAPRAAGVRRAGFLAELGWQMARRGEPGEPRFLDAIYLT